MISTGFKQIESGQRVPSQLENYSMRNDIILSRTRRRLLPTGNSNGIGPNQPIMFNLKTSSEWLDAATAAIHFKVTVPTVANVAGDAAVVPVLKPGGAVNIFKGFNLVCKGQQVENSLESGSSLQVWNALRSRLFYARERNITNCQLTEGVWENVEGNSLYDSAFRGVSTTAVSNIVYDFSVPLKNITNFFNLERSYLPLFAIPMELKLTTNDLINAFFVTNNGTIIANYILESKFKILLALNPVELLLTYVAFSCLEKHSMGKAGSLLTELC
jgi:hypothetical protein